MKQFVDNCKKEELKVYFLNTPQNKTCSTAVSKEYSGFLKEQKQIHVDYIRTTRVTNYKKKNLQQIFKHYLRHIFRLK